MTEVIMIFKDVTKKPFFRGWSWLNLNNLGLALGIAFKFYTSVAKGLKLKVTKFWGLILTSVEITGKNLVERSYSPPPSPHNPNPKY